MRDDIINILKNSDRALDIYELHDMLHINTVEGAKEQIGRASCRERV